MKAKDKLSKAKKLAKEYGVALLYDGSNTLEILAPTGTVLNAFETHSLIYDINDAHELKTDLKLGLGTCPFEACEHCEEDWDKEKLESAFDILVWFPDCGKSK